MPERYRIKLRDEEPWELAKTTNDVNLLKQLSEDENKWVRGGVALNPKTSVDMLKKLSEDKDWYVRESVASNLNTPVNVLVRLSKDKDRDVRTAVAKNSRISFEVLKQLSKDKDRVVRKAVAQNLNCTEDILRKLSEDNSDYVRREVVKNQSKKLKQQKINKNDNWKVSDIEPSGIEGLHIFDDEYPEIPAFSCILSGKGYKFELPKVYCVEADGEVHEDEGGYNGYWGVPIKDLDGEEFESDLNLGSIAEAISDYIGLDCEDDIVKVLEDASKKYYRSGKWKHAIKDSKFRDSRLVLKDDDVDLSKMSWEERRDLAYNTKDVNLLRKLAEDKDSWHPRKAVAENLNTPVEILKILAKDRDKDVRKYVAKNLNCTKDVLRQLAKDEDKWVRYYVSQNPNCTEDILKILSNDEDDTKVVHNSKKNSSKKVIIENGSYGLPVKVHLIGNVDKAYKSLKNSYYGFSSPDGAYTDIYIQEAINPQDEDIDCYVGYYPSAPEEYYYDDKVQEYIDNEEYNKAVNRIRRLAKQEGDSIYWCAGTWDDPWSESLGGYEIDSPESFEQ